MNDAPFNDPRAGSVRAAYAAALRERGFQPDPAQRAAVEHLERLRGRLIANGPRGRSTLPRLANRLLGRRAPRAVKGVYLWGAVGRGKTWLMDLFYQSLPFPERRRSHFHRFMHDVHAELARLQDVESPLAHVAERIATQARVVCFDELMVADIGDAMILGGLFEALFERGVVLVATSNLPPRELYRDGLQRQRFLPAIRSIEARTEIICVGGDTDYRLRQLTQAGTYLPSSDPATKARLEHLFEKLADGTGTAAGDIEIEGRRVPVIRESENVVWFAFAALCEGARSSADYIEIAREYQSVIVSDVPVLDATADDAARRFIALVDELYDRNVNLVVSAAAAPDALYRGERLAFDFRRTASRLVEMQTASYLAREHRP
jgi:cell division protein ZapE